MIKLLEDYGSWNYIEKIRKKILIHPIIYNFKFRMVHGNLYGLIVGHHKKLKEEKVESLSYLPTDIDIGWAHRWMLSNLELDVEKELIPQLLYDQFIETCKYFKLDTKQTFYRGENYGNSSATRNFPHEYIRDKMNDIISDMYCEYCKGTKIIKKCVSLTPLIIINSECSKCKKGIKVIK